MRVYSVANNLCQHKQNFGAVLVKDNVIVKDRYTGKPVKTAIIELETEERELVADLRMKHKNDIPPEEFEKRVDNIFNSAFNRIIDRQVRRELLMDNPLHRLMHDLNSDRLDKFERQYLESLSPAQTSKDNTSAVQIMDELVDASGEKIYLGDFEFMDRLTRTKNQDVIDINKRVQARKYVEREHINWMSKYLNELTDGKRKVMPRGGYGLLNRNYGDYLTYSEHSPYDSLFYSEGREGTGNLRQRILMAIEPQADYRKMSPYAKVHAVAEIFTDRAMDAVEDMSSDENKRMTEIISADKKFDELFQQWKNSGETDNALRQKLTQMSFDICHKYNIDYSDFMIVSQGKKYIKTNEEIYKMKLAEMGIREGDVIPVIINKLFSLNKSVEGAQNALMEVIRERGLFRGVYSELYGSFRGFCKNSRFIFR